MMSVFTLPLLLVSCSSEPAPQSSPAPAVQERAAAPERLTIYSGRGESLMGPLLERLDEDPRWELDLQYGDTAELVTKMLTEGAESPADLILAQDSGHLGVLADRGLLSPLPEPIRSQVDPRFQDSQGRWIGTSGRLRVLVYGESVSVEELPQGLAELADPRWKGKLGWAPSNASFQSHVSALRALWGEERTEAWLRAVMKNEPQVFPKNSPQVRAAHEGSLGLGWVNHYYLHRLDPEGRKAKNWSFPAADDAGNILMISGVGIRSGSEREELAQAFVEALISEASQTYFAQDVFEYPTRPGVSTHPEVQPLESLQLATVSQDALSDLGPTRELLRSLELL